jgi:DNA-directed RNA polymerase subunit RPC12/RpoP
VQVQFSFTNLHLARTHTLLPCSQAVAAVGGVCRSQARGGLHLRWYVPSAPTAPLPRCFYSLSLSLSFSLSLSLPFKTCSATCVTLPHCAREERRVPQHACQPWRLTRFTRCFLVSDCGKDVEIKPKDTIACHECGHRILYKKRTKECECARGQTYITSFFTTRNATQPTTLPPSIPLTHPTTLPDLTCLLPTHHSCLTLRACGHRMTTVHAPWYLRRAPTCSHPCHMLQHPSAGTACPCSHHPLCSTCHIPTSTVSRRSDSSHAHSHCRTQ